MKGRSTVLARSNSIKFVEEQEKSLDDLVKVEVVLSDKLFWWESPKVCRWEPWEESDEFAKLDKKTQNFNLHYAENCKKESEKLFSAPSQHHFKKKIQVKDFDLNLRPAGVDRSALAQHYLVPMMPEKFKHLQESLKLFEMKQREWRNILLSKQELIEADSMSLTKDLLELFEDTWKEFNVETVTLKQFSKYFEGKLFDPRSLFPVEHRKMIEVIDDPEFLKELKETRQVFRKQNCPLEIVDIGEERPIQNEPVALSEFLEQIERVKKSLQPYTWIIPEVKQLEPKSHRKKKAKAKATRPSGVSRTSQKSLRSTSIRKSRFGSRLSTRPSLGWNLPPEKAVEEAAISGETVSMEKKAMTLTPHHKGKWSVRDIYEPTYDHETKVVTFYTGSLGSFGFATRKYGNLPFKSWELYPVTAENGRYVILKLVTKNATIEIKISNLGYTFEVVNMKKVPFEFNPNPVKINELKRVMKSFNLNVFPEIDAQWYVEDICEKHKAMEFHTYKSMAVYCLSHHFKSNVWNRWAHRRIALFDKRMIEKSVFTRVMTTPLRTASVSVKERCTELEVVELDYEYIPEDQEVKIKF